MVRFFIIIVISLAFFASAFATDNPPLETLKVTAVVIRNFPLQYITDENGNPAGFAIDVMDEIAKLAKLHVNYLQVDTWSEMFEAVKSGRADLMPNLGITDKREAWFAFTFPVETFPISIFVREATNKIKGEQDLAGHRIAAVKMNVGVRLLKERGNIDMAVFEDVHDALMELLAGKVDALVYPKPVLMKIAVEAGLDDLIKTAGPPVVEIKRGISVRKDNTVLLERLNQAVNRFVGTKEYKAIYIKWYGNPAPYWTVATVVFFMGGALVIAVVIMGAWRYASVVNLNRQLKGNITERKLAEEKQRHLYAEIASKNKELEQVVYVTSHDLRTPLVNIEGFGKELERSYDELTALLRGDGVSEELKAQVTAIMENDVAESLMYISKSTAKMDSLLSGLLKLSRIGRIELTIGQIDMNDLMLDIMSTFEFRIKKAGIKVEVVDLPPCLGDEIQISQAFSNLIENAIKYISTNTKGIIRVSGFKEKGNSVYCVEDNGIGIEPAYKEIIFEIFHQLNPSEGSGEGLGLTIVQRAVERHHGKIWLESEPGKGSSFFISLPS